MGHRPWLARLAGPNDLPALVGLLLKIEKGPDRDNVEKAIMFVCQTVSDPEQRGDVVLAAAGLAMVAGGHLVARRGYALYGQIVAGGGFAALYVSVFAALSFYALIGRPAALPRM